MPTTDYFHGTRVFKTGETTRPITVDDYSTVGAVLIAPNADPDVFPEDVATTIFTNDAEARTALGAGGNVDAVLDAIDDQGVVAELQVVRVALGDGTGQTQIENTIANIVGSGADYSGVHAFKQASKAAKLIIAPGYTSQRISNAKNPVAAELEGICTRLKAIKILDTPDATKEAAETYREDFPDDPRAYLFHPSVKVLSGSSIVTQPGSGRVAGLFVKKDKLVGGPHESPSNQTIGGIVGGSRPISYYPGEPDSEANWLNEKRIATLKNGFTLWGNETCALDPIDRFVNVVRVQDLVDDAVIKGFDWAIDKNLSVPLGTAIIQSLQSFLDELVAKGAILGGRAWFQRDLNSNESLATGVLRLEYDREPPAPLQDLQFGARRNLTYYATLADGILQSLDRQDT
jgi:phage tail sheath protein FI